MSLTGISDKVCQVLHLPKGFSTLQVDSPWCISAKHHVLGACLPRMAPFRTRFSPHRVVYVAYVQGLKRYLYTPWYFYIPTYYFTAHSDLEAPAGDGSLPAAERRGVLQPPGPAPDRVRGVVLHLADHLQRSTHNGRDYLQSQTLLALCRLRSA